MKKKIEKPSKLEEAKSQKLLKAKQSALQKLKDQARVEAALDRVLTLAMGLKRSSELAEIVGVFQQELNKLKFNLDNCVVWIIDGVNPSANVWLAPVGKNKFPRSAHFEFLDLPYFKQLLRAWKKRESIWVYELKGPEKKKLDHQLFTKTELFQLPDHVKKELMATDHAFVSISFYNYGGLHVSTPEPLSKEQLNILNRFSKVFDLCFTRLKEIENAETHAREAEIEAALEKIRSRSLTMQSPGELQDVVNILFGKLKGLNIGLDAANINVWKPNSKDITIWVAESTHPYDLPYLGHVVQVDVWNAYERGDETFSKVYSRQEKDSLMKMLFEQSRFKEMTTERKQFLLDAKGYAVSFAFSKNVSLSISNLEGNQFSTHASKVLHRFAKVFEQAYIRFQDLQKSVAAARESQIQLSLERVRAKAMAMQKSTDVIQVMTALVEQLIQLGFKVDSCNFNTTGYEGDWHLWLYSAGYIYPEQVHIPEFDHPYFHKTKELHRRRMSEPDFDFDVSSFTKEEKDGFLDHVYSKTIAAKLISKERKKYTYDGIGFDWSVAFSGNTAVTAANYSGIRYTEEQNQILRRFCNAFEQSYRRFLDLQNAEAQAREAQIETALEKVRSRSLAMHKSHELQEVIYVAFEKLQDLGIEMGSASIIINRENPRDMDFWVATSDHVYSTSLFLPYVDFSVSKDLVEARERGDDFFAKQYSFEEKNKWWKHAFEHTGFKTVPAERKKFILESPHFSISAATTKNSGIMITNYSDNILSGDSAEVVKRFSRVFEQSYTRFRDLQKAEAQAKEAQIEAALERVRATTLAMHKSEQLAEVAIVLFEQFYLLGKIPNRISIGTINEEAEVIEWWVTDQSGSQLNHKFFASIHEPTSMAKMYAAWKAEQESILIEITGKDLEDWIRFVREELKLSVDDSNFKGKRVHQGAFFSKGLLLFSTNEVVGDDVMQLLVRFTRVFNQTYTRFLDLQRAEAQAREAQIESSLERVRSKTMAMHNSEDVSIATNTMFDEIAKLGVESMRCGIGILNENQEMEVWTSAVTNEGHKMKGVGSLNVNLHPLWLQVYKGWKKNDAVFFYHLAGDDLNAYYKALTSLSSYSAPYITGDLSEHDCYGFYFQDGAVFTFSYQPYSEEHLAIWKRFASVFSLTYRRYKDLKNAEAQTREAHIEAALERVRAKAMAMHSTADLTATVSTIFIELRNLGIKPLRFGLGIIERDTRNAALYSTSVSGDGGDLQLLGSVMLDDHPILEKIYDGWVTRSDGYFPVLKADVLKTYYEKLRPGFKTPDWHSDYEQYGQFYYFEEGSLYAWSEKPIAPSEIPIFKRFTSVLALTYKRYNELQLSEANALDAIRRSSIDRVRAEIASMRTTGDLERITPLIWNELTKLGVPFIRCGVFIMDDHAEIIHTFLSTPDGKAIGAFNLPYTTPGNIQYALSHWKKNEVYIDRWTEEVFRQFADTLVKQGALTSPDQYLLTIPHGGFYLHFLPFPQGMLYVGNTDELQKDHLQLIQAVTDAFSAAYTRYEDFAKLEAAKQQVDNALADLKLTQNQLVQAEKMASLGELTAGIAHEIQNPLNFVNNFSEVSNELVDEMVEEVNKGNFDEAKAIALDVKKNLDKINHHGKRADGIVKNMLQHSQSGTGQKELTDINQLCDEYVRLSYHGLRAKDKSFNAKIETFFDPTLGKINVIPQEIGRVVLNLVNNAFYAANEKGNNNIQGFEPKVSITTKKRGDRIEISVKDNGPGIPPKMLDKIFQPFFTTKPTGQGTGLGLSLSYDIIKVHGGELKVETKEGEGSEFEVHLPA